MLRITTIPRLPSVGASIWDVPRTCISQSINQWSINQQTNHAPYTVWATVAHSTCTVDCRSVESCTVSRRCQACLEVEQSRTCRPIRRLPYPRVGRGPTFCKNDKVTFWLCDIVTSWHFEIVTLWHYDIVTLWHCDIATLRHFDILTLCQLIR